MTKKVQISLKKKAIFFGLEDVLIPGRVEKSIDFIEVKKIFSNLKKLNLFVVVFSGFSENVGQKKLKKFGLNNVFKKDLVFFVSKDYLNSLQEIDKKRYDLAIINDPNHKDEYFKQFVIEKFAKEHNLLKSQMLLIGHDVWLEGFYTRRFSQIDFALIKSAHSHIGKRKLDKINGLIYINRTWVDIKKLLQNDNIGADYHALDLFVDNSIKEKLFEGTKIEGLVKKSMKLSK